MISILVGRAPSGMSSTSALLAAALTGSGGPAQAALLYGAEGGLFSQVNLYLIDPTTGAVTSTIGPIGFGVTGLAFDPIPGTLFGVTTTSGDRQLITIDPATGAGTVV